jgi:hypothetical protein
MLIVTIVPYEKSKFPSYLEAFPSKRIPPLAYQSKFFSLAKNFLLLRRVSATPNFIQ